MEGRAMVDGPHPTSRGLLSLGEGENTSPNSCHLSHPCERLVTNKHDRMHTPSLDGPKADAAQHLGDF